MTDNASTVQSEPGRFWIATVDGRLDEEKAIDGLLTVREDGQTEVELVGSRWAWEVSRDALTAGERVDVVGHLHRLGKSVALTQAWQQNFLPVRLRSFVSVCLSGDPDSPQCSYRIDALTIPLGNAWPWLAFPMPSQSHGDRHFEIRYPLQDDRSYRLLKGTVTVSSSYNAHFDMSSRSAEVKPSATVRFEFAAPVTPDEAAEIYADFEDFLVILTNQEFCLDRPKVHVIGIEAPGTLHCTRRRNVGGTVRFHDCWLPYPEVEEIFGEILDQWLVKRPEYGAAFHLYMGTRRGGPLYAEHRFTNLMFGLEALHRKHWPPATEDPDKQTRVKEILDAVKECTNASERRMIRKALQPEPRLATRLQMMFSSLPMDFPSAAMRLFAEKCADRRNDISHHGGPRDGASYEGFPLELHELSCALDPLYHALILSVISVPDDTIRKIFQTPHRSFRESFYLKRVGLEPPDIQHANGGRHV